MAWGRAVSQLQLAGGQNEIVLAVKKNAGTLTLSSWFDGWQLEKIN